MVATAKSIISQLLLKDPKKRMTLSQYLQTPWVQVPAHDKRVSVEGDTLINKLPCSGCAFQIQGRTAATAAAASQISSLPAVDISSRVKALTENRQKLRVNSTLVHFCAASSSNLMMIYIMCITVAGGGKARFQAVEASVDPQAAAITRVHW